MEYLAFEKFIAKRSVEQGSKPVRLGAFWCNISGLSADRSELYLSGIYVVLRPLLVGSVLFLAILSLQGRR